MAFESGYSRRFAADLYGPDPSIEEKPGLDNALKDPETNKLFSYFLEKHNKGSATHRTAWKRYLEGKPKEADSQLAMVHFDEFQKRIDRFEKVQATLSRASTDLLAHSPIFKHFRDVSGGANLQIVMGEGLRDLALSDPAEFARVEAEVQKLGDLQKEEDRFDKTIKEFADKHGIIDEAKLNKALAEKDDSSRQAALQAVLREGMSFREKIFDGIKTLWGGGTHGKTKALSKERIEELTKMRKDVSGNAGIFLQGFITKNDDLRHAIANLQSDKEAFPNGSGSKMPLREAREEAKHIEKQAAVERAKAFRRKHDSADWSDAAVVDTLRNEFYLEEELTEATLSHKQKSRGFFATLAVAIAKLFKPEKDEDIKNILSK